MPTSDERPKRVFVTATYDLAEPRRLVADAIRRAGGAAVTVEPWEPPGLIGRTLLNSDLVLMLIGSRYGSPSFGGISFPEYEYRLAHRAGVPIAAVKLPGASQAEDRQRWFMRHFNPEFAMDVQGETEDLPRIVESFLREIMPQVRRRASDYDRTSILRVNATAPVALADTAAWLTHLEHAYNCIITFVGIIDDAFVALRPELPFELIRPRQAGSMVASADRLLLHTASFQSPGFWEFFGKLNPLEVIRQYLNDRHERRKDREYREIEERKRLGLENELLKNKVICERLQLARHLGVPEGNLTFAANRLLFEPLGHLDAAQDQGVVRDAEIIEPRMLGPGDAAVDDRPRRSRKITFEDDEA